jgi:hypothetical protein
MNKNVDFNSGSDYSNVKFNQRNFDTNKSENNFPHPHSHHQMNPDTHQSVGATSNVFSGNNFKNMFTTNYAQAMNSNSHNNYFGYNHGNNAYPNFHIHSNQLLSNNNLMQYGTGLRQSDNCYDNNDSDGEFNYSTIL